MDDTGFTPLSAHKRVHIEIIGGDADGLFLDSHSSESVERQQVAGILCLTNNGEVGKGIRGIPLTKLRAVLERRAGVLIRLIRWPGFKYEYAVTEYIEEKSEVLIRMEYQGHKFPFAKHPQHKDK